MFYNMSQRIYLYLCFCGSVYFYVLCICRLRVYNNIWLKSSENEGYLKCLNLYFGGALHFLYLTRLNSTDRSGADNLRSTPYWRDLSKKRITLWDTCLNFPWYPGNAPIYDVVAATTTLVRLLCASYIVGFCECWFVCLYCCNNKKNGISLSFFMSTSHPESVRWPLWLCSWFPFSSALYNPSHVLGCLLPSINNNAVCSFGTQSTRSSEDVRCVISYCDYFVIELSLTLFLYNVHAMRQPGDSIKNALTCSLNFGPYIQSYTQTGDEKKLTVVWRNKPQGEALHWWWWWWWWWW